MMKHEYSSFERSRANVFYLVSDARGVECTLVHGSPLSFSLRMEICNWYFLPRKALRA